MIETELKNAIFAGLRRVAPESNPESLRSDQNIRESLHIDSFDFLSFLIALDEKLGIDIPETDYGKLNTMDDMVGYLAQKV